MIRPITVVTTKIIPPRTGMRTLDRPRVTELLVDALNYRLTLIQAGAGFGKTTALAALAGLEYPTIWYQIMEEDRDPLVFLLHLAHAARRAVAGLAERPITLLESWDGTSGPLPSARILDEWLDVIPSNKIFAVGGDSNYAEGAYGHCTIARRVAARVLADKVDGGAFSLDEARRVAARILRENAMEVFRL